MHPNCAAVHSKWAAWPLISLAMGTKYYTRFLLQAVDDNEVDEYSGVVEVQAAKNAVIEPQEIEALLANSFDIESDQVQLLNWSPLH